MVKCPECAEVKVEIALSELEFKIQCILLDFIHKHDCEIDHVEVDTRNFANLNVEVRLKEKK